MHRQKDGRFYVGFAPRSGGSTGTLLTKIADLAEAHGSGRVRTTADQKMIVLDVDADRVDSLVAGLEALDLPRRRRRSGAARWPAPASSSASSPSSRPRRARSLIDELERRLPDFDEPLTINVNGCPNACARIQVADIGLKGQLVPDEHGQQVEGFQVHLGGALGLDAGFGRKVRGLKVTGDELPDYVERVLTHFQAERDDGERFAPWVGPRRREAAAVDERARRALPTARTAATRTCGRTRRGTAPGNAGPATAPSREVPRAGRSRGARRRSSADITAEPPAHAGSTAVADGQPEVAR